jgi:hypothetical protein
MHFELSDAEEKAFLKFKAKRIRKDPTKEIMDGRRFSVIFTPSVIGVVVEVIDNQTGKTKDITDVKVW